MQLWLWEHKPPQLHLRRKKLALRPSKRLPFCAKKNATNTLHLVGILLADRKLQVQTRMILAATRPLRDGHLETLRAHKGQQAVAAWAADRADGAWMQACEDIVLGTICKDNILYLGFTFSEGGQIDPDPVHWVTHESEVVVAKTYLNLVIHMVSQRCWTMEEYCKCWPGNTAIVLHNNS